jgi:NADH-quinone oxidoreductase subunit G
MTEIVVEIDGQKIECQPGKMLIAVADDANIYIPRFCYHKKLSIAANCRMCLVEVVGAPKTLPACATPVADGMKVFTKSKTTIASQRAVMEFLLINHPLDCPICDQGGQCELQDFSLSYGNDSSEYAEAKRSVDDQDLGPLIATEMTRCIHCTRCVRFGQEIAGVREMGATGRGENARIGTYVKHTVSHEMSGNIIDLCPVGALTSKPFRFRARAWEMDQHDGIAAHDCVGSNVHLQTLNSEVKRVGPKENTTLNESWISDRDRFSYVGLEKDRLTKPMVKEGDSWREVSWPAALNFVAEAFEKVKHHEGADQLGAIMSPNTTTEEAYLIQKLMRALGSNNIDSRLRQVDCTDQEGAASYPGLNITLDRLEEQQQILLVGSNIAREVPILAHRLRKATLNGAKVMSVNMMDYDFNFDVAEKLIAVPSQFKVQLGKVLKSCLQLGAKLELGKRTQAWLTDYIETDAVSDAMAKNLTQAKDTCILLGAMATNYPKSSSLRYLAELIAKATGSTFGVMTEGANAAGTYLAGGIPHRAAAGESCGEAGLHTRYMFKNPLAAYLLHGVDPLFDITNPQLVKDGLRQAKLVVAVSAFDSPDLREFSTVILPKAAFTETSGTFMNTMGETQSFQGIAAPKGEARPAWKIYRVLGNLLELDGFDYTSSEEVMKEFKLKVESMPVKETAYAEPESLDYQFNEGLELISEVPMNRVDALVRRSGPLQEMLLAEQADCLRVNTKTAKKLNLKQQEVVSVTQQAQPTFRLKLCIDDRVPDHAVHLNVAMSETQSIGSRFGLVKLANG